MKASVCTVVTYKLGTVTRTKVACPEGGNWGRLCTGTEIRPHRHSALKNSLHHRILYRFQSISLMNISFDGKSRLSKLLYYVTLSCGLDSKEHAGGFRFAAGSTEVATIYE